MHTRTLSSVAQTAPWRRASFAAPKTNNYSPLTPVRLFSVSQNLQKKRKIAGPRGGPHSEDVDEAPSHNASRGGGGGGGRKGNNAPAAEASDDAIDVLDFSSLISAFGPMDTHFKSQLQALSHGGRFNPASLGALRVTVKSSTEPSEHEEFPLSELAQVVPRSARTISLLVNDKEYIKPIMSAVQSSKDYNQQPQRSEDNDLELILKVEMERKDDVVRRVKEATQQWRERVRAARTKHDKLIKDGKKTKAITADVAKKAEKELQKVQDKKMKEIDEDEARTIKSL